MASVTDLPRDTLSQVLATYGQSLTQDPRRTEALLRDLCGDHKREIFALVSAIRERVPADLLSSKGSTPREVLVPRLTARLSEDLGLSERSARWAVESWAVALGVYSADDLLAPAPQPPAPLPPAPSPLGMPAYAPPPSLPALIVAQSGGGQFASISEALRAAQPGHRILVRPGVYRESLVLYRPIELVAEGEAGAVVVESTGAPCIVSQAESALVRGLTLRQHAGHAGQPAWAVDIPGGQLGMEACDITCDATAAWSACIYIHGPLAEPRISACTMHDTACAGVLVSDRGRGVLHECDLRSIGGGQPAVAINLGGNPTFVRCRIRAGAGNGVWCGEGARGTLEECEIIDNALAGVEIIQGGATVLRRCRVTGGRGGGVLSTANGRGVFEECEIADNAYANVAVTHGGNPVLRGCRILGGQNDGVFVGDGGWGTFEGCEIAGAALAGVEITRGANPRLRRCRVHDMRAHSGILVWAGGQGVIEDCEVMGNARAGVEIRQGGNPVVRRCRITNNALTAVWVDEFGAATVENCELTPNSGGAWHVAPGCQVRRAANREW